MKNIDKIREMDMEELAEFLMDFGPCHICKFGEDGDESCFHEENISDVKDCKEGLMRYLDAESEESEPIIFD